MEKNRGKRAIFSFIQFVYEKFFVPLHPHHAVLALGAVKVWARHIGIASYNAVFLVSLNLGNSNVLSKDIAEKMLRVV